MRVLITQNHLFNLSGSEVATLELAEHLSARGDEVVVYTHIFDDPIKKEFDTVPNVRVVTDGKELDDIIKRDSFDLVWVHQQVIPEALFDANIRKNTYIVFYHMSPYHPLEFPISYELEKALASLILFNSLETKEKIIATGVLDGFPTERCLVFSNPAPDSFLRENVEAKDTLEKILVVTNHLASEITNAMKDLEQKNVAITVLGRGRSTNIARVTPELLQQYDVVITIGKTVQYAICSQVPVYCYDHFGGPGYITRSNYEVAAKLNFSGRGFTTKSPLEISTDIMDNYREAAREIKIIHQQYAKHFLLSSQIKNVETNLKNTTLSLPTIDRKTIERHKKIMELNMMFQNSIYKKDKEITKQKKLVEKFKEMTSRQENEMPDITKKGLLQRVTQSVDDIIHRKNK